MSCSWMSRVFEQPNAADINNRWKSLSERCWRVCTSHLRRLRADKLAACKTLAKSASETKRWLWDEPGPIQRRYWLPENAYTRATELLTFTELLLSSELSASTCSQCSAADNAVIADPQHSLRTPAIAVHVAAALRDSSGT